METQSESPLVQLNDLQMFALDKLRANNLEETIEYVDEVLQIAKVCHTTNLAYCQTIGDNSQKSWEKTPIEIQQSAVDGVIAHLVDHNKSPEDSHKAWMKYKEDEGWKFGDVKDIEAKTHPLLIPYEQLEPKDKIKDYLFRSVVHAFLAANGQLKKQEFDVLPAYVVKSGME